MVNNAPLTDCVEVEDDAECRRKLDEERKTCRASCERSKHCGNASEPRRVITASVARGGKKAEQLHGTRGCKRGLQNMRGIAENQSRN